MCRKSLQYIILINKRSSSQYSVRVHTMHLVIFFFLMIFGICYFNASEAAGKASK